LSEKESEKNSYTKELEEKKILFLVILLKIFKIT